jgi:anti-sigma-K factor RskA
MSAEPHVVEFLPAYTLDCLDEEEFVLISEHLAACTDCQAELHAYQTVADQLALAVPDADPPAHLKRRLMDRVQPARPVASAPAGPSGWQRLTTLMQRTTPVWGLAGLVVIVALAVSNVWLWQQLKGSQGVSQPEMQTITLVGTQAAPQATGLLIISVDGKHGTLVVDRLPPLDPDRQYQLWLIQDGQRTSGGVFSVSQDGYSSLWVRSPQALSSYSGFGITVEPTGGSPGPTGEKVLGSSL